ncbi:MAG: hypothetical protein E4G99_05985 [Anaerolineales bacterium]|nr:MAG: hypothetical protein E4G99_05985 [Anaerolineales bacterium]
MDPEEKFREAWTVMIKSGCYTDHTQEFLKAIDALFDADAIGMDVRDELITLFSDTSRSSGGS